MIYVELNSKDYDSNEVDVVVYYLLQYVRHQNEIGVPDFIEVFVQIIGTSMFQGWEDSGWGSLLCNLWLLMIVPFAKYYYVCS